MPPRDPAALRRGVRRAAVPVVVATPEVGLSYAILNRHLFMNRQDLRLPTCLLLDAGGNVVQGLPRRRGRRADREGRGGDRRDARPSGWRERCRFRARSTHRCRCATTCRTGASCSTRGSSGRGRRVRARRAGEPGRVDALPPGHAAGEERRDGPRAGGVRARARPAAGPGRGQQRSRRAARAGRRSRRRRSAGSARRSRRRPTIPTR